MIQVTPPFKITNAPVAKCSASALDVDPGARTLVLKPGGKAVADIGTNQMRDKKTVWPKYLKVGVPGAKGSTTLEFNAPVWSGHLTGTAFMYKIPNS